MGRRPEMAILSTAGEGIETREEIEIVLQIRVDGVWRSVSSDLGCEVYGRDLLSRARSEFPEMEYRLVRARTVSTTHVLELG